MPLTLKFIGALRQISGKAQMTFTYQEKISLKDLITNVSQEMPKLDKTFSDQLNDSKSSNTLVLINGREISVLNGLETALNDGDEIVFIPVVHGG